MKKSIMSLLFLVCCLITTSLHAASSQNQEQQPPLRWDLFLQPIPIYFLIGSLVLVGIAWLVWRKREERDFIPGPKEFGATDNSLKQFYGLVPVILGVHTAIALLVHGVEGRLLFSTYYLEVVWSNWIGLAEIMIALAFFYGGFTRLAAIILAFLWVLGMNFFGLESMFKSTQYLGIAAFFYLAGRGPYAIDRLLFPKLEPRVNYTNYALLFLRIGIGLNLIVFGFTEKLANIPLASSLLEKYAFLNFTTIPNEIFILLAGSIEVLGGLLIVFGIFPRTVALITLLCINASLTIYNWNELIDYLPLYGALAILLVWEPNNPKQKLLWVEGMRKNMVEG